MNEQIMKELPKELFEIPDYVPNRSQAILDYIPNTKQVGIEIGSYHGINAHFLLKERTSLHLFMVDNWKPYDKDSMYIKNDILGFHSEEEWGTIHDIAKGNTEFANSRRIMLLLSSEEASKHFSDKSLDFVFIDAGHTYIDTVNDIECWLPKVKVGGFISGHDYEFDCEKWKVKEAVNDCLVVKRGLQITLGKDYTWFCKL